MRATLDVRALAAWVIGLDGDCEIRAPTSAGEVGIVTSVAHVGLRDASGALQFVL